MATEKRLIDANELAHNFLLMPGHYRKAEIDLIDSVPTVDAVEVVHGRWNPRPHYKVNGEGRVIKYCDFHYCSECGTERPMVKPYNYCPNCGAKMDGERRTDNA